MHTAPERDPDPHLEQDQPDPGTAVTRLDGQPRREQPLDIGSVVPPMDERRVEPLVRL